ncbi:nucleotidyltransferase domain-containing protein [Pseudonocardia sp. CA-107938]|uniref:FadR/GntR family transcriptional regulator n=1 Tax=Pseudonocardia sp. CA-107938 TaxID=3240021 RepID=UPI003D929D3A
MWGDVPDGRRIAAEIEQRVRSGRLGPGDRLPAGAELAAQFGVDIETVEGALEVLEDSGLVRRLPGQPGGVEMLPFSATMLRRSIERLAELDAVGLPDLIRFRILLEGWAYQLAAQRATAADLDELDAALSAMAAAAEDGPEAFAAADVAFHRVMARVSGDEMLQVCQDAVRDVVTGLISHRLISGGGEPELLAKALDLHVDLLAAVRAGDGEAASRIARRSMRSYLAMPSGGDDTRPALVPPLATTAQEDVLGVLDVAAAVGTPLWLDGGWAVDALLGRQTRYHGDVDVVVPQQHAAAFVAALGARGYVEREGGDRAENVVLADPNGRQVDLHVIELDDLGNGWYGTDEVYPADALRGVGAIAGRPVQCISAPWLVQFHTGYAVDVDDWHDVCALCARFDLPVPPDYAAFHAARGQEGGPGAADPVR